MLSRSFHDVADESIRASHQFYRNSFKQLTDIQQRQVGLILGAAVADSAVYGFDQMPTEAVDQWFQRGATTSDKVLADETQAASLGDSEVAFPPLHAFAATNLDAQRHSLSGSMMIQLVHTMGAARCSEAVNVDAVAPRWVALAEERQDAFAALHQRPLHAMACLAPLACTYPWADDEALWNFASPLAEFLLWKPSIEAASTPLLPDELHAAVQSAAEAAALLQSSSSVCATAPQDSDAAVVMEELLLSQSVMLRFLQSNPDPIKNAALIRNWQHAGRILPEDVRRASLSGTHLSFPGLSETLNLELHRASSALSIVRQSRSFAHGIRQLLRRVYQTPTAIGGPPFCAQQAMLVGAALGAKFGVRNIPMEWLSATPDHHSLGTLSIEVCQWSWNPAR